MKPFPRRASGIVSNHIGLDAGHGHLRTLMTGQRAHQPLRAGRTTSDAIHSRHVYVRHGLVVVKSRFQRILRLQRSGNRPAASANQEGNILQCLVRFAEDGYTRMIEELAQAHLARAVTRLPQRHRAHLHPRNASRARMVNPLLLLLIGRDCRSGHDKLADALAMVHGKPHSIPQLRNDLPFVEQFGFLAGQQGIDVHFSQNQVSVEIHGIGNVIDTVCVLFRCGGLAAPLGALHQHGSRRVQFFSQNGVRHTFFILEICHILSVFDHVAQR